MRIGYGVSSWSRFTGYFALQRLWPGHPGQAWRPRMTLVTACFAACESWVLGAPRGKAHISHRNRRYHRCHGLRRFATCSFRPEIPGRPRTSPVRRVRVRGLGAM